MIFNLEDQKKEKMRCALLSLFAMLLLLKSTSHAQSWEQLGIGSNALKANNAISALCFDKSNGALYAGGQFTNGGSSATGYKYIAKWNGNNWEELGVAENALRATGNTNAICVDASHNVYTVGKIDTSGKFCVMKWNGVSWSELGTGINALGANNIIKTICADAVGNIYAAGMFTNGSGKCFVAKWDGVTWAELGSGTNALNANDWIHSIMSDQFGNIYAAGSFTKSGYVYVAKWDGMTWERVGGGSNPLNISGAGVAVNSIYVDGSGSIYAGGAFLNSGGNQFVTKWNGSTWSELGSGTNALKATTNIETITGNHLGHIFAAGIRSTTGSYFVSKWNGVFWQEVGSGSAALDANEDIYSICTDSSGAIYAAGEFSDGSLHTEGFKYVAKFNIPNAIFEHEGIVKHRIYPSPANTNINVETGMDYCRYSICDYLGNTVLDGYSILPNFTVDISHFSPGLYFLKIEQSSRILSFIKL